MTPFELLHAHPAHRSRQLRWVVPLVVLLVIAVVAVLAAQYFVSGEQVQSEFFKAHKTIHHTSELLWRGTLIGGGALLLVALAIGVVALRASHRIVRPVHALHVALDRLAAGDLDVRVDLHERDEFHDVAASLNTLVDEFATTLGRVHAHADALVADAEALNAAPGDAAVRARLLARARELDADVEFFRLGTREPRGGSGA